MLVQTLNFNASFSYGNGEQSTTAFARQIGTIVALSSADKLLFGLPDLTSACVPVKNNFSLQKKVGQIFAKGKTHLIRSRWEGSRRNWRNNETLDRSCCSYRPLSIHCRRWDFCCCYCCCYWSLNCRWASPWVNFSRRLTVKRKEINVNY